jgi:ubiquinone biosynthesis protein Coq4
MGKDKANINLLLKLVSNYMDVDDTQDIKRILTMIKEIEKTSMGDNVASHLMKNKRMSKLFEAKWEPNKISIDELKCYPEGSLGKALLEYYTKSNLSNDINNPFTGTRFKYEKSYIHARMRETHDLLHIITGFGTDGAGEVALNTFCLYQHKTIWPAIIILGVLMENIAKGKSIEIYLKAITEGITMANQCDLLISHPIEEWYGRNLKSIREDLGVHNPCSNVRR